MNMGGFYTPEVEFQKYVEHLGVELAFLEAENKRLQAKVESVSTNTLSTEIALELDGIAMVLERHPDLGSREIERLNAVIARLRT